MWKNEEEYFENGVYFPDMMVREAKRFLNENRKNPFFLYLPYNTPHYPMQAEQRFVKLYNHITDPKRKRYAAFVTSLDDKIGQVLDTLDALNLTSNTIVIFLSDHGHSVEERAFGGGGSAGPYRGHKFTVWEGGIRVPCIVSWPGHIPEGETRDQMACSIDWFPTLAALCGVPLPDRKLDGKSIRDIIGSGNAASPHKVLHWERGNMWAVREKNWKLVSDKGDLFLSNMDVDVTETKNIAEEHPAVVKRMVKMYESWKKEVITQ
jgi:arylsulfatase A-like enzyme